MNLQSWIVLGAVLVLAVSAVIYLVRHKGTSCGGSGCTGCCKDCAHCKN